MHSQLHVIFYHISPLKRFMSDDLGGCSIVTALILCNEFFDIRINTTVALLLLPRWSLDILHFLSSLFIGSCRD